MSDPTDTPTDHESAQHESAQQADEDSVKYSHPGAPTPPGDESGDPDSPTGKDAVDESAAGESESDDERVRNSHPGSPTPPGDTGN